MGLPQHFILPTGTKMPAVGFGTSVRAQDKPKLTDALQSALAIGYRSIDTAWKYGDGPEIGAALKNSPVPREELFITHKFWPNFARNPELGLDISMAEMGLDYVDLLMIHWPTAFIPDGDLTKAVAKFQRPETAGHKWAAPGDPAIDVEYADSLLPMWRKMEELQRKGKARALGVSNCTIEQLEDLLPYVSSDTPLCVNQIEAHPWYPNTKLIEYCHSKGIVVQAYCPFGSLVRTQPTDGALVEEIAQRHGWGLGQVLQSWAVQRGTSPLGKSVHPDRIKSNFDVGLLTKEEMKSLDALDEGSEDRKIVKDWR